MLPYQLIHAIVGTSPMVYRGSTCCFTPSPPCIQGVPMETANFDTSLLEQCRLLQPAALDVLFRQYEKPVIRLIYRMVGARDEAEDIAQEVFVKIVRALPGFRGDANLTTWIYRITMNHCLNYRRKWFIRQRTPTISLDVSPDSSSDGAATPQIAGDIEDPMRVLLNTELHSKIQIALQKLSPQLRSIIILRDIEGMNYEEISETLGISMGTVKSRINRARSALREELRPYLS